MFTSILTRLSPYSLWIRLFMIIAALTASFVFGYRYRSGIEAAAKLDLVVAQAKAKEAMRVQADQLSEKLEQNNQKRETKTRIITKEVTKYVQTTNSCKLDAGYRILHDLSAGHGWSTATGPISDAKNRPAEVATSTESNAVLETVSENYATCLRWKDQVDGWQELWVGVVNKH